MATPKGKDVYQCYFATSADNPNLHKCRKCLRKIKQIIPKGYANLVSHVDHCMKDLGQPKNAALLRTKTRLRPEKRIKIRWSSLFSVLKKWLRIRRSVSSVTSWPAEFLDLIPTALDNRMIDEHIRKLRNFESVSKKLQSSGDKRLNIYQSRVLLDKLIVDYGDEFPLTALKRDAKIVQNKHFESGIFKIQGGLESTLTRAEEKAIEIFLKQPASLSNNQRGETAYADAILEDAADQKRRRTSAFKYRCTNHISPTTNIVEIANSHVKLNMTDKRSHMHPETLQLIMILKLNKSLWPSELTIHEILDKIQEQSESEDVDQDDDDEDGEDDDEDDEGDEDEEEED